MQAFTLPRDFIFNQIRLTLFSASVEIFFWLLQKYNRSTENLKSGFMHDLLLSVMLTLYLVLVCMALWSFIRVKEEWILDK